jgi:hypothetical protein
MPSLYHHNEQSWVDYVYTPLLDFQGKNFIRYFTFKKEDYKSLFKEKWRNIKVLLSKTVGKRVKHPCTDCIALYISENL